MDNCVDLLDLTEAKQQGHIRHFLGTYNHCFN